MNLQELINLAEGFKDIPVGIRRAGWRLWSEGHPDLTTRNRVVDCGRSLVCCPWGTIAVSFAVEHAMRIERADGLPGPNWLQNLIPVVSNGTCYLSDEAATQVKPFMHLIDAGRLTDDQIHRIMVPEDFAEATC